MHASRVFAWTMNLPQFFSSTPATQSRTPLHNAFLGKHLPSAHFKSGHSASAVKKILRVTELELGVPCRNETKFFVQPPSDHFCCNKTGKVFRLSWRPPLPFED